MHPVTQAVRALLFDVFGTVVDWRGSIIREGERLGRERELHADWGVFADAWRAGYAPAMQRVREGKLPWTKIDNLHRMILDDLIERFNLSVLDESERENLNRVWHRLRPWPDSVRGLRTLKERFVIAPLSNGNVALLVNMARSAALPWDCILSAEVFRHYKPDPEVYLGAAQMLCLAPDEVMMVAAHKDDLFAAKFCGLCTRFLERALEHGPGAVVDVTCDPAFDVHAKDFGDLADQLLGERG